MSWEEMEERKSLLGSEGGQGLLLFLYPLLVPPFALVEHHYQFWSMYIFLRFPGIMSI